MSSNGTIPPYVFAQTGTFPAPFEFDVPGSLEIRPDTAHATFDGSGAGGDFLACLTFYDSNGNRLARMFNPTPVTAGDVAEVTFIPPFGSAAATSTAQAIATWGLYQGDVQQGGALFVFNGFLFAGQEMFSYGVGDDSPSPLLDGFYNITSGVEIINPYVPDPATGARVSLNRYGTPFLSTSNTFPLVTGGPMELPAGGVTADWPLKTTDYLQLVVLQNGAAPINYTYRCLVARTGP